MNVSSAEQLVKPVDLVDILESLTSFEEACEYCVQLKEKAPTYILDESSIKTIIREGKEHTFVAALTNNMIGDLETLNTALADPDKILDPSAMSNAAIRWACRYGHVETFKILHADKRVDPSDKDNSGLDWASENGHLEIAKLLLADERVDPGSGENQAIGFASDNGHLEIVKLLLVDKRADPSAGNNDAIRSACRYEHLEIFKVLLADERIDLWNRLIISMIRGNTSGEISNVLQIVLASMNVSFDGNESEESDSLDIIKQKIADVLGPKDVRLISKLITNCPLKCTRIKGALIKYQKKMLDSDELGSQISSEEDVVFCRKALQDEEKSLYDQLFLMLDFDKLGPDGVNAFGVALAFYHNAGGDLELIPEEYKILVRLLPYLSGLSYKQTNKLLEALGDINGTSKDFFDQIS